VDFTLQVKARSPVAHTLFLGYSNGFLGYIPPPTAFDEGGMEVRGRGGAGGSSLCTKSVAVVSW
jgi:hypothetical protein